MSPDQQKQLIFALTESMTAVADEKTKQWFENYLKGAIAYRGLKTPAVTQLVKAWRTDNNIGTYSIAEQLDICESLISNSFAEDKFAGIIYTQKYLSKKLDCQTLGLFADRLFQQGYFYDWSTTDWFCVRVLDPAIVRHGSEAAEMIALYRNSTVLWQRRASIVSFRHASVDDAYHNLIQQIIAELVREDARFIQTGIGWVLSDMSKVYPKKAEALFRQYLPQLSREVVDRHSKYLEAHKQLKKMKREL